MGVFHNDPTNGNLANCWAPWSIPDTIPLCLHAGKTIDDDVFNLDSGTADYSVPVLSFSGRFILRLFLMIPKPFQKSCLVEVRTHYFRDTSFEHPVIMLWFSFFLLPVSTNRIDQRLPLPH